MKHRKVQIVIAVLGVITVVTCVRSISLIREKKEDTMFKHKTEYIKDMTWPSVSQKVLDDETIKFYELWKAAYVKKEPYVKENNQYYVWSSQERYDAKNPNQSVTVSVSEAHGYGMLITVYMADYDAQAKEIFDGMVRYYQVHRSDHGPNLMSWIQADNGSEFIDCPEDNTGMVPTTKASAADGDLDIAYALLAADKQWGSDGEFNYKQEALRILSDIMEYEVDQQHWSISLGDWVKLTSDESVAKKATRSSDFMMNHFKQFALASNDERWNNIISNSYQIVDKFTKEYATGLLPDFILWDKGEYTAAYPNFLENENDGAYWYNACRDPWRIGTDYLLTGDTRAKEYLQKVSEFMKTESGQNPSFIKSGYHLTGEPIEVYNQGCYTVPVLLAAMSQSHSRENQAWVDALWTYTVSSGIEGYFSDNIKMLCLITAGGHWWTPFTEEE